MTAEPLVIRSMVGVQGLTYVEQYGRTRETHTLLTNGNQRGPPQGVLFKCRRTEDELYQDMQDKVYVPNYVQVSDAYFREAELLLVEMGVGFCQVDFMREQTAFEKRRGHAARLVRGSGRIPLVVSASCGQFVVKPYDKYNQSMEKKVLEIVSGKIGPKVLHLGSQFYAEELLSKQTLPTLDSKSDRLDHYCAAMGSIVEECARTYADLAGLGINYNHGHCMDEFRSNFKGTRKVIDFGTARLFELIEEDMFDKRKLLELQEKLDFQERTISLISNRGTPLYDAAFVRLHALQTEYLIRTQKIKIAKKLTQDDPRNLFGVRTLSSLENILHLEISTLINLYDVVQDAHTALETFFERRHFCMRGENKSGAEVFEPHRQRFTETFLEHYLKSI